MIFDAEPDPSLPARSVLINYVEEVRDGETITVCGANGIYTGFAGRQAAVFGGNYARTLRRIKARCLKN